MDGCFQSTWFNLKGSCVFCDMQRSRPVGSSPSQMPSRLPIHLLVELLIQPGWLAGFGAPPPPQSLVEHSRKQTP